MLIERAILRQIALLWQTRPLRRERLFVADEVEIALAYFRDMLASRCCRRSTPAGSATFRTVPAAFCASAAGLAATATAIRT